MSDSVAQMTPLALQLKEGAYTRVECDMADKKPSLYAVDQQGGPAPENKVKVWKRSQHMVLCFESGQNNYLLKVDGSNLTLELAPNEPDIASLADSYWFYMERAAASEQYRIHSKSFPGQCLIIKEENDRLFDLGDMQTTTFAIAVFITRLY